MINLKQVDSDAHNKILMNNRVEVLIKSDTKNHNSSGYKTIKVNLEGETRTLHDIKSYPKYSATKEKDGEDIEKRYRTLHTNQTK